MSSAAGLYVGAAHVAVHDSLHCYSFLLMAINERLKSKNLAEQALAAIGDE